MSNPGSVSAWIKELKAGDTSAATHLWNRYFHTLMQFARQRLRHGARRVVDEEDLAATAIESLFGRLADGQFSELSDREQLWAVLVTITDRKAVNTLRRHFSDKRGGGKVRGESTFDRTDDDATQILAGAVSANLMPDVAARISELTESLDHELRQVIHLRLDGYTNNEIGQRLNRSVATVERWLRLLRHQWHEELFG
jgi:RNA polymerase sigma factor (sigma-70 family)